jgi:phenylalanyl-tRNA synthetase beta chain
MKASYQWLRKLVPQLTASPQELADKLTALGLEVEGITHYGAASSACIVVKVVALKPHPSKSGLRLITIDSGGGPQAEIVCGAPNVPEPGGLVVLAPLGTHLPAVDMTIARRDIGGVVSEGMLCSEAELGLSADSSGILVLPRGSASAGAPLLAAVPEASDFIFEIGLTPNRADCLGHVGIAREIAAAYGARSGALWSILYWRWLRCPRRAFAALASLPARVARSASDFQRRRPHQSRDV